MRLEAARAVQRPQEITVDESREILELEFEGGIRQFISLQDFRSDYGLVPSRDATDVLEIPMRLGSQEETRGLAADLTLTAFRVIGFPLEERAAEKVADYFEAKVQHGLHAWNDAAELEQATVNKPGQLSVDKPLLVFLHGTASNTIGSFGGLAEKQPEIWQSLLKAYQHRIYAFEHATLSKSPIENVIDLLKVLPTGARLHLVSHSRGGLLGELLCRADVRRGEKQSRAPFDDLELKQFGPQHKQQRNALIELSSLLESKRPQVERYVRVACPAAGTVLASDRLDRYFSLLFNTFGAATGLRESFTYDFFTSLAMAAAKKRADPKKLPGIEAMVPTSPLVKVLNRPGVEVSADLSVIAGDIQATGIWQRLKVWATDLFYWQDHDLVVHTKAMYGGVKRTGGARYFFDKGPHVSHFNYFRNRSSATKLLAGLTHGEGPPDGFKDLVPGAEPALRSARRDCTAPRGVVYLLPGIMGSQLAVGGDEIWMDPIGLANGGIERLAIGEPGVEPIGIIRSTYAKLVDYLSRDYEVVPFPYDWRRSLLEEGRRFGSELMAKLDATPLPVHVVAHSMGGLLTRAMMAERAEAWDRFKQRSGRVVMLGTPNKGSFFINNVLLGREQLVAGLSLLDFKHCRGEILGIFRQFRGLLEMLPMDSADGDYHSPDRWRELHAACGSDCDWQIPDDADLEASSRLRRAPRPSHGGHRTDEVRGWQGTCDANCHQDRSAAYGSGPHCIRSDG